MRKLFKKILQKFLYLCARRVLILEKPEVIGITGSVGKTSTKEAIYAVLSKKYSVWRNQKNYNNEIGLPLTILGLPSGGRSIAVWLLIICQAFVRALVGIKNYPKILVLEMGADHPGDMKYLTKLAPCQIGVVTTVAPVHLEFFKTLENISKEKGEMVRQLNKRGLAVLNADNPYTRKMAATTNAAVLTFGFNEGADVRASEMDISYQLSEDGQRWPAGLSFKVAFKGSTVPMMLPKVLAKHLVPAALAAIAVGLHYGLHLVEIGNALRDWEPPKGRMHLLPGANNTLLIDDTYNASPDSTVAALHFLLEIKPTDGARKWAVLGDLLELGDYTQVGHEQVAQAIVDDKIDYLLTVGNLAKIISEQARNLGRAEEYNQHFAKQVELLEFLQSRWQPGDVILVKGSQGARMEKIVKALLANPDQAQEMLVRQEKPWLDN